MKTAHMSAIIIAIDARHIYFHAMRSADLTILNLIYLHDFIGFTACVVYGIACMVERLMS